jgi:hypothetical protein
LRFEFDLHGAVFDRDPIDVCSLDLDDVSSPLSAFASVLRKSVETKNEGGQSDCHSQQNQGGSRLQVTSGVQELRNFRSSGVQELQNQKTGEIHSRYHAFTNHLAPELLQLL